MPYLKKCTKSIHNTKCAGPAKKLSMTHNNQNTKCTGWRKNIKVCFYLNKREIDQLTYRSRPIKIIPDFTMGILRARRVWRDVGQTLRDYRWQLSLLYQQNYQSQYNENEKYSTIKPN